MQNLLELLFAQLQQILPHHAMSRLMYRVGRSPNPLLKNSLIHMFRTFFGADLSEALYRQPVDYSSFNEFFTRPLAPGVRPVSEDDDVIVCPVDGRVYEIGRAAENLLVQAKGRYFSIDDLLGGNARLAGKFANGPFVTLYLAPGDYHRVHMPLTGSLTEMIHVPGSLFSVNAGTARALPRLFARNERVVCVFSTDAGAMAVVLVGALFVGSIETTWAGEVTPRKDRNGIQTWRYGTGGVAPVRIKRAEELGRFNMGSTVIVLFENEHAVWDSQVQAQQLARMGMTIGRVIRQGQQ